MAISFHLQSLLENHQSHLPPKGAKGEEVNKMTRFRNQVSGKQFFTSDT